MTHMDVTRTCKDKESRLNPDDSVDQTYFQTAAWYQALTLTERTAALRALWDKRGRVQLNNALAERRMQHWRSQPPFPTGAYFAQRLATAGISEEEFRYLLAEPVETLRDRFLTPPAWLEELAQAFSRPPSDPTQVSEAPEEEVATSLDAIAPLIHQGRDRLHRGVQALIQMQFNLPFDPTTVEEVLFAKLPSQLLMMMSRTMVLELHVARLQGLLQGGTPEERFRSFLHRLRQHDVTLAILQEYPVLARQLTGCINQWATFSLEFLHHLCEDWEAIRATFSPERDPGVLVELDSSVGDSHRGGRSVMIAKFSSGFQVVYKPKSLSVDVHFQELLTWLNDHGDHPPFYTLKILDRGAYGWVEFVVAQGCTTTEQIQRFYARQGGYLALLYALEATDFHSENLIATSEHSVLVDLEALFHPRLENIGAKSADQLADATFDYSVLRVGLLPQRIWSNEEFAGIDLSGLGAAANQLTPDRLPYWEGSGTDEMRLKRQRMEIAGGDNRPTLNGDEVHVLDYAEAITAGFTQIYRLLLKHRDELLSGNGFLARFADDPVRVILRATRTYGLLQYESFHPDVLRDALDRDRLFDRLWAEVQYCPQLAQVISAECEDLQQGDIPMFTTRPRSRDLWSSSNQRIVDFFDASGMALVQRRLQQLSEEDLEKQLWFIRASLTTLARGVDQVQGPRAGQTQRPTPHWTEPQAIATRDRLLAAARAVGDRLELLALQGQHSISWIGLTPANERYWSLVPLGMDLYSGMPGVALFLAYLGAITREGRYMALAQAALITLQRQVEDRRRFVNSIGGFTGWGGVIYTLTHLGSLWDRPDLLAEAEQLIELLPPLIEQDEQLDIINGAAGCIGCLTSLYRCRPSDRILQVVCQCGDRLIARAQPMEQGLGWVAKGVGAKPLAGFSHGAAGIAWALLELTSLIRHEERYRTTALAAIAYERSLFSPEAANWADLRDDAQETFMITWCNGAPGIGLARLHSLQHLHDAATRAEIDVALQTTLAQGFGGNHSLCHGDLGNLELLLQASHRWNDGQLRGQVNRIATWILDSAEQHGWLCGVPQGVETPGLMTGLAGIGYGLLRLAEPTQVPSVLVLAPPVLRGSGILLGQEIEVERAPLPHPTQ